MSNCSRGVKLNLEGKYNDLTKPWFRYDSSSNRINILNEEIKNFSLADSIGAAKTVARNINNQFAKNNPYVGKVAWYNVDSDTGYGYVEVHTTDTQLDLINNKDHILSSSHVPSLRERSYRELLESREGQAESLYNSKAFLDLSERLEKPVETATQSTGNSSLEISRREVAKKGLFALIADRNEERVFMDENSQKDPQVDETLSPREMNNNILFGGKESSTSAMAILQNIINSKENLSDATVEVLQEANKSFEMNNAKVKIVDQSTIKEDSMMEYDASSRTIYISKETLDTATPDEVVQAFMHEVSHNLTLDAMIDPTTSKQVMFKTLMEDMYAKYSKLSESSEYGFSNAIEFVAEMHSNPAFREHFKDLEGGNKSMWNKLIDNIRALIGLPKKSDYNKVISAIYDNSNPSSFEDSTYDTPLIFQKKRASKKEVEFYNLSTVSSKTNYAVDEILDNLERSIYEYDKVIQRDSNRKNTIKYKKVAERLAKQVDALRTVDNLKAISKFTDYSNNQLGHLKETIDGLELKDSKNPAYVIRLYEDYLGSHRIVKDLNGYITDLLNSSERNTGSLNTEDLRDIRDALEKAEGTYETIKKRFNPYRKEVLLEVLSQHQYNTEILKRWHTKIGNEYTGSSLGKEAWIQDQMDTKYKDDINKDIRKDVISLLENHANDIAPFTTAIISAENTRNVFISKLKQFLESANQENITNNQDLLWKLNQAKVEFDKANPRGRKPSERFKGMYTQSKSGRYYLKGEWKIEFFDAYQDHVNKINELKAEGKDSKAAEKAFQTWRNENTDVNSHIREGGYIETVVTPKSQWRSDLDTLSDSKKKLIETAKEVFLESDKKKFRQNSIVTTIEGAQFIAYPTITKDMVERGMEGETVSYIKDKAKDLFRYREDHVDFNEGEGTSEFSFKEMTFDRSRDPEVALRIHYRGILSDPSQQSLDLFSLMALEGKNGNSFEAKNRVEDFANVFLDAVGNKKFYRMDGSNYLVDKLSSRVRLAEMDGTKSEVYKRMQGMIETHVYDIFRRSSVKINDIDANKVIDFFAGYTAMLGMGVNTISSSVNYLNGKMHTTLEAIGGYHLDFKSLTKARKTYMEDSINIMRDSYSPVKTSYTNQIMELFDTEGNRGMSHDHRFVRDNFFRAKFNTGSLMTLQTLGEHMVQGTMTMGFLDKIKVMDGNSKWINKDGVVVDSMEKAASMLDMIKKDDTGKIYIDDKVAYTSHTPYLKINEGGKELLNRFIRKKMKDTVGNYDPKDQGELYKLGVGRLLLMFKRYLTPMVIAKFRGMRSIHKDRADIDGNSLFFNEALQEQEIGTYAAAARVVVRGLINMIQQQKLAAFKTELSDMSAYEKAQARKGFAELTMISVMLPTISGLTAVMAKSYAQDDDDYLWYIASTSIRLQTEMQSFVNPMANYRLFKSPFASMHVFETASTFLWRTFTLPFNGSEVYEGGENIGQNKWFISAMKATPVIGRRTSSYKAKRSMLKAGTYDFEGLFE